MAKEPTEKQLAARKKLADAAKARAAEKAGEKIPSAKAGEKKRNIIFDGRKKAVEVQNKQAIIDKINKQKAEDKKATAEEKKKADREPLSLFETTFPEVNPKADKK